MFATVWLSTGWFFQGGGWNQNAHFATTVALVDHGTLVLDTLRGSTGDLARSGDHVVSAKAVATALTAVPAYLVAKALTAAVDNPGNRVIVRAYLTSWLTAGTALAALSMVLLGLLRRRLPPDEAYPLALGLALATPLFPNSTMLTSHPLAALSATAAYALLEAPRLRGVVPSPRTLAAAGLCAGAAAAYEYMLAVLVVPLGAYALWQARPRAHVAWFAAGVAAVVLVPAAHHLVVYGNVLSTGYAHLTDPRSAHDAALGLMGFDGFALDRLYEITFGPIRGFFFLSPLLVGLIPGIRRALRDPRTRPEAYVTGSIAVGVLLLVASLAYWHSGSAVGSRYALVFIPFCAVSLATLLPAYRAWLAVGGAIGFAFMAMATAVTAIPPTPGRRPYENVIGWLWTRFSEGRLASWQQPILIEQGVGTGHPTLPFAFNLGQLLGLPGHASLVPWLVALAALVVLLRRAWRALPEHATRPAPAPVSPPDA